MQPAQDPWVPGSDQAVPSPDAPQPPPAADYPAATDNPPMPGHPPATDNPPTPGYPPAADYGYQSVPGEAPTGGYPGGYPPGGGYAAPPGYPYLPPPVASGNQFGLLSMIFGIVSIPFSLCCSLGVALGIAGLVLGVLAVRSPNPMRPTDRNQGIAGLACGGVAILLTVGKFALVSATFLPAWPHH